MNNGPIDLKFCTGVQSQTLNRRMHIWGEYGTYGKISSIKGKYAQIRVIVSPVRSTYGGYYGLVVVTPRPRPQTLHRSHDNLKNPYRIASIFYM